MVYYSNVVSETLEHVRIRYNFIIVTHTKLIMANNALQLRDESYGQFSESIRQLERYFKKDRVSLRLLEEKINAASLQKDLLIEKHVKYVRLIDKTPDSTDSISWL